MDSLGVSCKWVAECPDTTKQTTKDATAEVNDAGDISKQKREKGKMRTGWICPSDCGGLGHGWSWRSPIGGDRADERQIEDQIESAHEGTTDGYEKMLFLPDTDDGHQARCSGCTGAFERAEGARTRVVQDAAWFRRSNHYANMELCP